MLALVLLAATAAGAAPAAATASAVPESVPSGMSGPNDLPAPHRFRSGIVVGLQLGGGAVGASGYPNDVSRIGDPNFYSASGAMLGTSESVFLLGALTDYLSFGFWFQHASAANRDWDSRGDGGGLRVEAFPLVGLVPSLHGLGTFAQFGVGSGRLTAKMPNLPPAEGTQSYAGVGAFWEWPLFRFLGGYVAAGPSVEFDAIWSQSFERHSVIASARLVFYGGPQEQTAF